MNALSQVVWFADLTNPDPRATTASEATAALQLGLHPAVAPVDSSVSVTQLRFRGVRGVEMIDSVTSGGLAEQRVGWLWLRGGQAARALAVA